MARIRFPLSSEQLELLLTFESADGLQNLAAKMAKDASVVSRNLQKLAEAAPVLEKSGRRWQLTELGRLVNAQTRSYLEELTQRLEKVRAEASGIAGRSPFAGAALLVINAQKGLLDTAFGGCCNPEAENNVGALLKSWREQGDPVLHIRHVSQQPSSRFRAGSDGAGFLPGFAPVTGERVIDKAKSSAFSDTSLQKTLEDLGLTTLILTGFTANECIDATARQASDLGFTTYVVGDATASFAIHDSDGKLYDAEHVHRLTMANLHALFAKVVATKDILGP